MKCRDLQLLVPDYLQGQSSADERMAVEAHLSGCTSCAGEVREMSKLMRDLKSLTPPRPPHGYWESLLPRIHDRRSRNIASRTASGWSVRFVAPAAALGLMVALLSTGTFKGLLQETDVKTMISGLSGDELQLVADQTALSSELSAPEPSEPSLESTDDVDVLTQLLSSEDRTSLYGALDLDDATSTLSEQEESELISSLQDQSSQY